MNNFHTSPDLFNPEGVTNVFNPHSREMLGQIRNDGENILTENTRDGQGSVFDNTSDALQSFTPMLKMNEELIYKIRRPTHKIFSKGYWNRSDIDEIVNRILGEPQARMRESWRDGHNYSESTKPTYYRDNFIMNCF